MWFHVVSDGAIGNISNAVIKAQMNVLNLAFAGFYGGANTGFSFALAGSHAHEQRRLALRGRSRLPTPTR